MSTTEVTEPAAAASDTATGDEQVGASSGKPMFHEVLFPVNVSYFSRDVKLPDGREFASHDFSISVASKSKAGETQWRSITIKRRDAHKLLTALQSVYRESYLIKPQDDEQ